MKKSTIKGIITTSILGSLIVIDIIYHTYISMVVFSILFGMLLEKGILIWQLCEDIKTNTKEKYMTLLNDDYTQKKVYACNYIKSNGLILSD